MNVTRIANSGAGLALAKKTFMTDVFLTSNTVPAAKSSVQLPFIQEEMLTFSPITPLAAVRPFVPVTDSSIRTPAVMFCSAIDTSNAVPTAPSSVGTMIV